MCPLEFHLYVLHGAQFSGEQKLLCVRASVLVCSDVFDRGIIFFGRWLEYTNCGEITKIIGIYHQP